MVADGGSPRSCVAVPWNLQGCSVGPVCGVESANLPWRAANPWNRELVEYIQIMLVLLFGNFVPSSVVRITHFTPSQNI
jgi:hypothetical protein